MFSRLPLILGMVFLTMGCATDPRDVVDYSTEPIGMQLLRTEPMLKGRRFNTLLSFESADDVVFVSSRPEAQQTTKRSHTGKSSAALGTVAKLNLGSVMSGRPFPGEWTLAGGYLWSDRPAEVSLRCKIGSLETTRTLQLAAGKWTPAFLDLTQMKGSGFGVEGSGNADAQADDTVALASSSLNPEPRTLNSSEATLTINSNQPIFCDDVMILENTEWYVEGDASPWVIRQRGFKLMIEREGWFNVTLDTVDMSRTGWELEDASTMRATFSSSGKTRRLTVYSDGRTYWDGRFEPLSSNAKSDGMLLRGHESPGTTTVVEGLGRADRNTPGDANNDAYNETLGAYQAIANGPRTEITLAPGSVPLVRPIVEIAGLPPGKTLVTLEGRLIESQVRLKNGNLLIEVPARIERSTTLNIRVDDQPPT